MTHRLAILAMPLALAACTATAAGSITPSTSPSKAPTSTASKAPSSAPAAGGSDTFKLTVDGKAKTVAMPPKWTPTDVIGMRTRLSFMAGPDTPKDDEANVGMLFGGAGAGKSMMPGWDTKAASAVFSVTINYYDEGLKRVVTLIPTTNTADAKSVSLEAKDGRIKGKLEGDPLPSDGSKVIGETRVPVVLEFDLAQPALK